MYGWRVAPRRRGDEIPLDVALGGRVERAVLDLIAGDEDSAGVEELAEAA
jgi:hypothetical protein